MAKKQITGYLSEKEFSAERERQLKEFQEKYGKVPKSFWSDPSEAAFAAERERQIKELKKRETEDFYCHEHDDKEMSKCYVQCPFCERV